VKTLARINVGTGGLLIVLREDGGVYVGHTERKGILDLQTYDFIKDPLRVGSSSAICAALGDAFHEMATIIRSRG
jgi:hypothetical protein